MCEKQEKLDRRIAAFFCCLLSACIANAKPAKALTGIVSYKDSSPAPGVVVYAPDICHRLEITNNIIMMAGHISRTITDAQGRFIMDKVSNGDVCLFARDLEDRCAFTSASAYDNGFVEVVIQKPATVKGQLFKGDKPVKGQKVTAFYLVEKPVLQYVHTAVTNQAGAFELSSLMPGEYLFQVIQEVPQVRCSFRSVVTKQLRVTLRPGQEKKIKLGGTDLPFLRGKITDADGNGLHGVWVRLKVKEEGEQHRAAAPGPAVVWSDVTERDGSYQLFDVPPGRYTLHCFRRLALNNYTRTLQATENVVIPSPEKEAKSRPSRVENICNLSIDLESFMPLKYGQTPPSISGTLLDGQQFNLSQHRGKIVVLYFYASWCSTCVSSAPVLDELADKFDKNNVVVLGICLDNSVEECRRFVSEKRIRHPQLFAGPWTDSPVRKTFRVVDVPTTFVIDAEGKIAQIDLFDRVLENFIEGLLK